MNILIAGATGKTGRIVVEQLLQEGHSARIIVRSRNKLSAEIICNTNLTIIEAAILDMNNKQLEDAVKNCDAIISCLGHTLSFKGIFDHPRALCTDAIRRLCEAVLSNTPSNPVKIILMNSVGVANPKLAENRNCLERALLFVLRHTTPPHRDNEMAAGYLHDNYLEGDHHIEWCTVRPDSLIDADVSDYDVAQSPITTIFSGRPTSRANVAHFIKALVIDAKIWQRWKFTMPVIMNTVK